MPSPLQLYFLVGLSLSLFAICSPATRQMFIKAEKSKGIVVPFWVRMLGGVLATATVTALWPIFLLITFIQGRGK